MRSRRALALAWIVALCAHCTSLNGFSGGNTSADAGVSDAPLNDSAIDPCEDGGCASEVFVGGQAKIDAIYIAPDDGTVFWTDSEGRLQAKKPGGALMALPGMHYGTTMSSDVSYLYVFDTANVYRIARDGTAAQSVIAGNQNANGPITALATDSANVYWTNSGSDDALSRLSKAGEVDGGLDAGSAVLIPWLLADQGVGINDTTIYTVDYGPEIYAFDKTNLTNVRFARDEPYIVNLNFPLVVDATGVTWFTSDKTVVRRDSNLGTVFVIAPAQNIQGFTGDGTYIYWSDDVGSDAGDDLGSIQRARLDGTGSMIVAGAQNHPAVLGAANGVVYWSALEASGATYAILRKML
jgi:hypothetical protein